MSTGWIAWWAQNRIAANLLMFSLLIAGYLGMGSLNREVFPTFNVNYVLVQAFWPGAQPKELESQVASRLENALGSIDGVVSTETRIYEGRVELFISAARYVEIDDFIREVDSSIDSISGLPAGVESVESQIIKTESELVRLAVVGNTTYQILQASADTLRERLLELPSVPKVQLFGDREQEIAIEVSQFDLDRYDMTINDLSIAIRSSSFVRSLGSIEEDKGTLTLSVRSQAEQISEFEEIIVKENPLGGAVTVGDVAKVKSALVGKVYVNLDGQPAILVQAMSSENTDVVDVSRDINEWVEKNRYTALPKGIGIILWQDQIEPFNQRVYTIVSNALIGGLLVMLVLLVFLQIKVAIWVTVGILTAYIGTFAFLPFMDVTINMISLFAFLMVLGIVVDDAIIVGENIHAKTEKGEEGESAAINGTMDVYRPVIFAVLTTILTFSPWFFLSGDEVTVTRQLTIIITVALALSLVESLLILPAHLNDLKKVGTHIPSADKTLFQKLEGLSEKMIHGFDNLIKRYYKPNLLRVLKNRAAVLTMFVGSFVLSIGMVTYGYLPAGFAPEIEADIVSLRVNYKAGTSFEDAEPIRERLESAYKIFSDMGEDNPVKHFYTRISPVSTLALLALKNEDERSLSGRDVANIFAEEVGDIPLAESVSVSSEFSNNGNALRTTLLSSNEAELDQAIGEVIEFYESLSGVRNVRTGDTAAIQEYKMKLKPGANSLGLSLDYISTQVRQAYFGLEVQRLVQGNEELKIMVRYPREDLEDLRSLSEMKIRTPKGDRILLSSLVDFTQEPSVGRLVRVDGKTRKLVRGEVVDRELKGNYYKEINEFLDENIYGKYPSITKSQSGEDYETSLFFSEVISLYTVAFFLMYALLAIAFNSYWLPLVILSAIPFAVTGAFIGHMIMNTSLSIFSYFGVAAAVGVVVNDNLVLIDRYLRLKERGSEVVPALIEAAVSRFRPIFLTSLTTFVSLLGIMAETSVQAQVLKPAVISIAFGILFCITISLFMVPAMLMVIHESQGLSGTITNKARGLGRSIFARKKEVAQAG